MDGISALSALRADAGSPAGNLPVILLTAKGEDADKVLGLNLGADDYIEKPYDVDKQHQRQRNNQKANKSNPQNL